MQKSKQNDFFFFIVALVRLHPFEYQFKHIVTFSWKKENQSEWVLVSQAPYIDTLFGHTFVKLVTQGLKRIKRI